jgi:hypothetical protein
LNSFSPHTLSERWERMAAGRTLGILVINCYWQKKIPQFRWCLFSFIFHAVHFDFWNKMARPGQKQQGRNLTSSRGSYLLKVEPNSCVVIFQSMISLYLWSDLSSAKTIMEESNNQIQKNRGLRSNVFLHIDFLKQVT